MFISSISVIRQYNISGGIHPDAAWAAATMLILPPYRALRVLKGAGPSAWSLIIQGGSVQGHERMRRFKTFASAYMRSIQDPALF